MGGRERRVAALLALIGLAACSQPPAGPPPGIPFPRHTSDSGGPAALFDGHLRMHDGCLVLEADGSAWVAVWPPAWHPIEVDGTLGAADGHTLVRVGDHLQVGGGDIPVAGIQGIAAFTRSTLDDIAACRSEQLWFVTTVTVVAD